MFIFSITTASIFHIIANNKLVLAHTPKTILEGIKKIHDDIIKEERPFFDAQEHNEYIFLKFVECKTLQNTKYVEICNEIIKNYNKITNNQKISWNLVSQTNVPLQIERLSIQNFIKKVYIARQLKKISYIINQQEKTSLHDLAVFYHDDVNSIIKEISKMLNAQIIMISNCLKDSNDYGIFLRDLKYIFNLNENDACVLLGLKFDGEREKTRWNSCFENFDFIKEHKFYGCFELTRIQKRISIDEITSLEIKKPILGRYYSTNTSYPSIISNDYIFPGFSFLTTSSIFVRQSINVWFCINTLQKSDSDIFTLIYGKYGSKKEIFKYPFSIVNDYTRVDFCIESNVTKNLKTNSSEYTLEFYHTLRIYQYSRRKRAVLYNHTNLFYPDPKISIEEENIDKYYLSHKINFDCDRLSQFYENIKIFFNNSFNDIANEYALLNLSLYSFNKTSFMSFTNSEIFTLNTNLNDMIDIFNKTCIAMMNKYKDKCSISIFTYDFIGKNFCDIEYYKKKISIFSIIRNVEHKVDYVESDKFISYNLFDRYFLSIQINDNCLLRNYYLFLPTISFEELHFKAFLYEKSKFKHKHIRCLLKDYNNIDTNPPVTSNIITRIILNIISKLDYSDIFAICTKCVSICEQTESMILSLFLTKSQVYILDKVFKNFNWIEVDWIKTIGETRHIFRAYPQFIFVYQKLIKDSDFLFYYNLYKKTIYQYCINVGDEYVRYLKKKKLYSAYFSAGGEYYIFNQSKEILKCLKDAENLPVNLPST